MSPETIMVVFGPPLVGFILNLFVARAGWFWLAGGLIVIALLVAGVFYYQSEHAVGWDRLGSAVMMMLALITAGGLALGMLVGWLLYRRRFSRLKTKPSV